MVFELLKVVKGTGTVGVLARKLSRDRSEKRILWSHKCIIGTYKFVIVIVISVFQVNSPVTENNTHLSDMDMTLFE